MIKEILLTLLGTSASIFATRHYIGKLEKENRQKEEQIEFSGLAQSLADDYVSIYYVNKADDSYAVYGAAGVDKKLTKLSQGDDFFADTIRDCARMVHKEDQERFLSLFTKEALLNAANNNESYTVNYRLIVNGEPVHYSLKTIRQTGTDDKYIIIGVQDIDEQARREAAAAEESNTYNQIAKALASPYEVIYYVNIETNEYTEYSSSDKYAQLKIGAHGDDFFADSQRNMKISIYPEDYPRLAAEIQKERFLSQFESSGDYSLTYRLVIGGKPEYVNLRAVKSGIDDKHVIFALSNIDASVRREQEFREEHITFSRLAWSLANDYESIYYINTEDNSYVEYGASGDDKTLQVLSQGEDFFTESKINAKRLIFKEDQEKFIKALDKNELLDAIKNDESFTLTYRLVINEDPVFYYLKATNVADTDDKYIIVGIRNIDAQTKRNEAAAEESDTYNQIAKALASRYEVIYYVDTVTDAYIEYSSSEKYTKLKIGIHGNDFFGETQQNMKRDIHPEDYPMMAAEMQKDRFLSELEIRGNYSITYRLMLDGKPEYVNLRAMKSRIDDRHIIVAVSNIDASVRREQEFKEELGTAMDLANKDSLTGVKSKHAYTQSIEEIDNQIKEKAAPEFAVVVFDVNDLKKVNDTQGHSAGDEYIRSACRIICKVFKHSPVYRIGGDEFVALLKNDDYEDRELLLGFMRSKVMDNKEKGLVTIACGMSAYHANHDHSVSDVFERADNAMYTDKKQFKN